MSRIIDFDAARAEREREPLLLRAYGREFSLPPTMPATLFLDIIRLQDEGRFDDDLTDMEAYGLLRRVVPASVLDELRQEEDFAVDDYADLCRLIMQAYMQTGEDGPGEPEAPSGEKSATSAKSPKPRGSHAASKSRKATTTRTGSRS